MNSPDKKSNLLAGNAPAANILALCKIGCRKHIEQLRQGKIYAKHIGYFKELEDNNIRGDIYECSTGIFQIGNFKVSVGDSELPDFAGPASIYDPQNDKFQLTHLLCTYGVSDVSQNISENIKEFGDTVLLIHPRPFINQLCNFLAINKKNIGMTRHSYGIVKYVDSKLYSGDIDAFTKLDDYSWQSEFRFGFKCASKINIPIEFNIGDLSAISQIGTVDEFLKTTFQLVNA